MSVVKESDLLGIGKKYHIVSDAGDHLIVVIHDSGRRELYTYDDDEGESQCIATLSDEESRQLGGIIGGMSYKPKALETIEVALNDLIIEWYKVEDGAKSAGKTIGDLGVRQRTGASIIAAIKNDETVINPGPDYTISVGAMLVVAGRRNQIKMLKEVVVGV